MKGAGNARTILITWRASDGTMLGQKLPSLDREPSLCNKSMMQMYSAVVVVARGCLYRETDANIKFVSFWNPGQWRAGWTVIVPSQLPPNVHCAHEIGPYLW